MKTLWLFFLVFLNIATGCRPSSDNQHSDNSIEDENQKNVQIVDLPKLNTKLKIGDYLSDSVDYFWNINQVDSSKYWIRLVFQKDFVVYQFNSQCYYWFFTKRYFTGDDKIELLWSYKSDCLLDMDFLRNSNGVKKSPKFGDTFCEFKLVNDSTIEAKYLFPEWIEMINKMENDSIFPVYFYLNR